MPLNAVQAYAAIAPEYVEAVGRIEHAAAPDVALVENWARRITWPILDVGCRPGQWTHYLASLGVDVEGVDPVPTFIDMAKAAYPSGRYRLGRAETLCVSDASLGGILAWYSLIHTEPENIGAALTEFARCIRPGGGLALGFFENSVLARFDHAVTTVYCWPIDLLSSNVESAGFTITHTGARTDSPARAHGAILATRV